LVARCFNNIYNTTKEHLKVKRVMKMESRFLRNALISVIVGISFLMTLPSMAQDESCDVQGMKAAVTTAQNLLEQAQTAIDSNDMASALTLIREAQGQLSNAYSRCEGWYFEDEGPEVLGPLELGEGVYIIEYASEVPDGPFPMGIFSVEFENLDEDELIWDSIMEMRTEAGAFNGRQTVRLEGGRYLISIDAAGIKEWSLELSKP
jgi:hypothetical protein